MSLRAEKEQFVSNLPGTTLAEIVVITSVLPAWRVALGVIGAHTPGSAPVGARAWPARHDAPGAVSLAAETPCSMTP